MPSAGIVVSSIIGISAVVFGGDRGLRHYAALADNGSGKVESNRKNASRWQPDKS
jgi:hypothetical protein